MQVITKEDAVKVIERISEEEGFKNTFMWEYVKRLCTGISMLEPACTQYEPDSHYCRSVDKWIYDRLPTEEEAIRPELAGIDTDFKYNLFIVMVDGASKATIALFKDGMFYPARSSAKAFSRDILAWQPLPEW